MASNYREYLVSKLKQEYAEGKLSEIPELPSDDGRLFFNYVIGYLDNVFQSLKTIKNNPLVPLEIDNDLDKIVKEKEGGKTGINITISKIILLLENTISKLEGCFRTTKIYTNPLPEDLLNYIFCLQRLEVVAEKFEFKHLLEEQYSKPFILRMDLYESFSETEVEFIKKSWTHSFLNYIALILKKTFSSICLKENNLFDKYYLILRDSIYNYVKEFNRQIDLFSPSLLSEMRSMETKYSIDRIRELARKKNNTKVKLSKYDKERIQKKCEDERFSKILDLIDDLRISADDPVNKIRIITNYYSIGYSGEAYPTLHLDDKVRIIVYEQLRINLSENKVLELVFYNKLADLVLCKAEIYAKVRRKISSKEWEQELDRFIAELPKIVPIDEDNPCDEDGVIIDNIIFNNKYSNRIMLRKIRQKILESIKTKDKENITNLIDLSKSKGELFIILAVLNQLKMLDGGKNIQSRFLQQMHFFFPNIIANKMDYMQMLSSEYGKWSDTNGIIPISEWKMIGIQKKMQKAKVERFVNKGLNVLSIIREVIKTNRAI